MKTITFYSYKGGVGRTLALVNIAKRLSNFGKKVCVLDFDLEAPGLPIKFRHQLKNVKIEKGIVDYIHEFTENNVLPESIMDYKVSLNRNEHYQATIDLIAAGNTNSNSYWKKLISINWSNLFYSKEAVGVRFFLDLKEKIREELKPDYLLIDSRTGFTETSGVTMSILADEVVLVSANNEENLLGIMQVWKGLLSPRKTIQSTCPKIHFVISRIPYPEKPDEKDKESIILLKIKHRFDLLSIPLNINDITIIHSDRDLELDESNKIGIEMNSKEVPISLEYSKLFERITEGDFKKDEIEKFNRISEAEKIFKKGFNSDNEVEKLELYNKAIMLDNDNIKFLLAMGWLQFGLKNYTAANDTFNKVLEINKKEITAIYGLGWTYYKLDVYEKAIETFTKAIDILTTEDFLEARAISYSELKKYSLATQDYERILELNPQSFRAFNGLSNVNRLTGKIDNALSLIYKALKLNPNFSVAYLTLAEIKAILNQDDEFYINLEIGLRLNDANGTGPEIEKELFLKDAVYEKYLNEDRFKQILEKYNLDLDMPIKAN